MLLFVMAIALGIVLAPILRAGLKLLGLLILLFIIFHFWSTP